MGSRSVPQEVKPPVLWAMKEAEICAAQIPMKDYSVVIGKLAYFLPSFTSHYSLSQSLCCGLFLILFLFFFYIILWTEPGKVGLCVSLTMLWQNPVLNDTVGIFLFHSEVCEVLKLKDAMSSIPILWCGFWRPYHEGDVIFQLLLAPVNVQCVSYPHGSGTR